MESTSLDHKLGILKSMGFPDSKSIVALKLNEGDLEAAIQHLLSIPAEEEPINSAGDILPPFSSNDAAPSLDNTNNPVEALDSSLLPFQEILSKGAFSQVHIKARTLQKSPHVGLANVGNTCFLSSILQILFNNTHFLDLVLRFRLPDECEIVCPIFLSQLEEGLLKAGKKNKNMDELRKESNVQLILAVRWLFCQLLYGVSSVLSPQNVVNHFRDRNGDPLVNGSQEDFAEYFQLFIEQIASSLSYGYLCPKKHVSFVFNCKDALFLESLEDIHKNVSFPFNNNDAREIEFHPEIRMKEMFYGSQMFCWKDEGTAISSTPSPDHWEEFFNLIVDGTQSVTLLESLKKMHEFTIKNEDSQKERERTLWIKTFPEFLNIQISRVLYQSQASEKKNEVLQIPSLLFVDFLIRENEERIKQNERLYKEAESHLQTLIEMKKSVETWYISNQNILLSAKPAPLDASPQDHSKTPTLRKNCESPSAPEKNNSYMQDICSKTTRDYSFAELTIIDSYLDKIIKEMNNKRDDLLNQINELNAEMIRLRQNEENIGYELYATIIHSGSVDSGHYWINVKNMLSNKWMCFNDSNVLEVDIKDVIKESSGELLKELKTDPKNVPSANYLIYSKKDIRKTVIKTSTINIELLKGMRESSSQFPIHVVCEQPNVEAFATTEKISNKDEISRKDSFSFLNASKREQKVSQSWPPLNVFAQRDIYKIMKSNYLLQYHELEAANIIIYLNKDKNELSMEEEIRAYYWHQIPRLYQLQIESDNKSCMESYIKLYNEEVNNLNLCLYNSMMNQLIIKRDECLSTVQHFTTKHQSDKVIIDTIHYLYGDNEQPTLDSYIGDCRLSSLPLLLHCSSLAYKLQFGAKMAQNAIISQFNINEYFLAKIWTNSTEIEEKVSPTAKQKRVNKIYFGLSNNTSNGKERECDLSLRDHLQLNDDINGTIKNEEIPIEKGLIKAVNNPLHGFKSDAVTAPNNDTCYSAINEENLESCLEVNTSKDTKEMAVDSVSREKGLIAFFDTNSRQVIPLESIKHDRSLYSLLLEFLRNKTDSYTYISTPITDSQHMKLLQKFDGNLLPVPEFDATQVIMNLMKAITTGNNTILYSDLEYHTINNQILRVNLEKIYYALPVHQLQCHYTEDERTMLMRDINYITESANHVMKGINIMKKGIVEGIYYMLCLLRVVCEYQQSANSSLLFTDDMQYTQYDKWRVKEILMLFEAIALEFVNRILVTANVSKRLLNRFTSIMVLLRMTRKRKSFDYILNKCSNKMPMSYELEQVKYILGDYLMVDAITDYIGFMSYTNILDMFYKEGIDISVERKLILHMEKDESSLCNENYIKYCNEILNAKIKEWVNNYILNT